MFRLITSEIRYNKILWLNFLMLVPVIIAVVKKIDYSIQSYLFLLMAMMMSYWNIFMNKAYRPVLIYKLLITFRQIALARAIMVISMSFFLAIFYIMIDFMWGNQPIAKDIIKITSYIGFVGIMFSGYFIGRDLSLQCLRHNRYFKLTKERSKMIFLTAALLLNLGGVFTFFIQPKLVMTIIEFLIRNNPVATPQRVVVTWCIMLVLTVCSIISFDKRKAYLE
ncbi:hypothetical protein JW960_10515 [candidate division KSB1 bacterium]|nr:hypothetical protein [candidate division KSB1 bacterium]